MTEDIVAMTDQGYRSKGLDQTWERMSVGGTVSVLAGLARTLSMAGRRPDDHSARWHFGDPHGITSSNEFQIFDIGVNNFRYELLQVRLVTYFSLDSVWYKGLNGFTLGKHVNREIHGDLVSTNWLVCRQVPKSIEWSRISNASAGERSQMVENGCCRDGVFIYLLEDEETMLGVILLEMRDRIKLIGV